MGLVGDLIKAIITNVSSVQSDKRNYEQPRRYSPEGFVVREQEQSGESWHGIPLSELSKLAQDTFRGRYVKVDAYGYLVFYYSSNSGKTGRSAQYKINESGQLEMIPHNYYPGQWRDSSDEFAEKANQIFSFE